MLKNRLKASLKKNVPYSDTSLEDYDAQVEYQIISENLTNINNARRSAGDQRKLNKIFHISNRLKLLFKYCDKFPDTEFVARLNALLTKLSHCRALVEGTVG